MVICYKNYSKSIKKKKKLMIQDDNIFLKVEIDHKNRSIYGILWV